MKPTTRFKFWQSVIIACTAVTICLIAWGTSGLYCSFASTVC